MSATGIGIRTQASRTATGRFLFVAAAFGNGCLVVEALFEGIAGHLVESGPPAFRAPFGVGQNIA